MKKKYVVTYVVFCGASDCENAFACSHNCAECFNRKEETWAISPAKAIANIKYRFRMNNPFSATTQTTNYRVREA